ncbi:plasmid mobilization relaxosome protein MobC [Roseibium album]|uniref:Mobilisation protein (MobC) n=1 Tax=Roseibium album TaxID=311410 RepID=A0A0M6ZS84_9HYPH|nr:MobC family plasmid mobilization relaxosome protein [Roseibium album]CTQ58131.1 hypothetical protein LA5094_00888 [Roseibium album]CTQ65639.1 hypothetical protein LA5096_00799 [Roseibium album]CTQ70516.1 hypothetical protein LA5095_01943 [Roseibium album]
MSELKETFHATSVGGTVQSRLTPITPRPRHKTTRDCPRVTVRLSLDDYERLQTLAGGRALSVYLRAKGLEEPLPKRKTKSSVPIADRHVIAQLLGILGQSRIANNLNQLAYHANVGSFAIDDDARSQINEAYEHVLFIRKMLLRGLGYRE